MNNQDIEEQYAPVEYGNAPPPDLEKTTGIELSPELTAGATDLAQKKFADVFAKVMMAKAAPRDEAKAITMMVRECESFEFADDSWYSYPRGKDPKTGKVKIVEGHNIRVAEMMAKQWRNLEYGLRESARDVESGISDIDVFCWDLQQNVTIGRVIQLPHRRDTKSGGYKLKGERDIRELVLNIGQRVLRSCIMAQIPPHAKKAVRAKCIETLARGKDGMSMAQRVEALISAYRVLGVPADTLSEFLGHKLDDTTPREIVTLRSVYKGIEAGSIDKREIFELGEAPGAGSQHLQKFLEGGANGDTQWS